MQQRVFLARIDGHAVLARHAWIDKFQEHFVADAFNVSIPPDLKRKRAGRAAAFFDGTVNCPAGGMRLDFIRLPVNDVDAPAVGLPTRNTRREPLVRIGNTRVMFFFEFVVYRVGRRIPAKPKLFDELLTLLIRLERFECGALLVRDDVGDVLVEPLAKSPASGFLFTRPLDVFRHLLLRVLFLRVRFLLRNRPGGSQKQQRSEGDENPSSAHKTPRVRLVTLINSRSALTPALG